MNTTTQPRVVKYTDSFTPNSSVIRDVYYDATNNELWVVTHDDNEYGYGNFFPSDYTRFKSAPSIGYHWSKNIQRNFLSIRDDVVFEEAQAVKANAGSKYKFSIVAEVSGTISVEVTAASIDEALAEFHNGFKITDTYGKSAGDVRAKVKEVTQKF